jgi:hypothetical protein
MNREMNIQHSTLNAQLPRRQRTRSVIDGWTLKVECPAFLLLIFSKLSLSAQTPANALSPLSPAYPEMPPTFWERHESTIVIAGLAVLAVVFLFLRVWLRPKPPVVLPLEALTRQALMRLQGQPEDGKMLSEISQLLRRYFSAALDFPAGELTTAEFSTALAGCTRISAELAGAVSDFLRECDERKFSTATATAPAGAAQRALEILSLAEQAKHRQDAGATS